MSDKATVYIPLGKTTILRHGRFFNRVVRFVCECGCIFKTGDLSFRMSGGHDIYTAYCPECDAIVTREGWPDQFDDEQYVLTEEHP